MSLTSRSIFSAFLVSTVTLMTACTAILDKDVEDDGVARCDNADDCESLSDNRFVSECDYGASQDQESQGVCYTAYADVPCQPSIYGDGPMPTVYAQAEKSTGYLGCGASPGAQGCEPGTVGCQDGLTENIYGVCDVADPKIPAVQLTFENRGQDVLDQFCRNRFCDDRFVCDTNGATWRCKPCDGSEYGMGGCGELYSSGDTLSTIYVAQDENDSTCGERSALDENQFGTVPADIDP